MSLTGRGVRIGISANAKGVKRGVDQSKGYLRGLGRFSVGIGRTLRRAFSPRRLLMGFAAGLASTTALVMRSLRTSGEFESLEVQFENLFNSVDKARDRMEEIERMALSVPVEVQDLAKSSRMLEVFTDGALGAEDSLRRMADAAAWSGQDIKEVSFWVGRAYSMIKSGRPFGVAAMRLQQMGLMTADLRNEMEDLGRGGRGLRNADRIWELFEARLDSFGGASARAAETWAGLISMFKDARSFMFKDIGDAMMPVAKERLEALTEALKDMRSSGAAARIGEMLTGVFLRVESWAINMAGRLRDWYGDVVGVWESDGLQQAVTKAVEESTSTILKTINGFLSRNASTIFKVGHEIGAGIADGLAAGFAEGLKDVPILGHIIRAYHGLYKVSKFTGEGLSEMLDFPKRTMGGVLSKLPGVPSDSEMLRENALRNSVFRDMGISPSSLSRSEQREKMESAEFRLMYEELKKITENTRNTATNQTDGGT